MLLTTPESLEAMLISLKVEHGALFAGVRAIVVDEVHAFAGDDRGWHLLAVLERLTRVTGQPIQRSACRPRSGTRTSCWAGCRVRGAGSVPVSWWLLGSARPGTAPGRRPGMSSWITWGR